MTLTRLDHIPVSGNAQLMVGTDDCISYLALHTVSVNSPAEQAFGSRNVEQDCRHGRNWWREIVAKREGKRVSKARSHGPESGRVWVYLHETNVMALAASISSLKPKAPNFATTEGQASFKARSASVLTCCCCCSI